MSGSRNALGQQIAGEPSLNTQGLNQHHPRIIMQRRIACAIEEETRKRPQCVTSFARAVVDALEFPTTDKNDRLLRQVLPSMVPRELPPIEPESSDDESEAARDAIWTQFASRFVPSGPVDAVAVAERSEDDERALEGAN